MLRRHWWKLLLPAAGLLAAAPAHAAASPADTFVYNLHAAFRSATGSIVVTDTTGFMGLPVPIDVDHSASTGIAGFDVVARIQIDAGRATLDVTKLQGAPASMPLAVTADLADFRDGVTLPGLQTPSNARIAFGYDALSSTAPAAYSATLGVAGAQRASSFKLDLTTVSPGSSLAVTGEMYTPGAGGAHDDPIAGRIAYAPVPKTTHASFLTAPVPGSASSQQTFDVTSDIATTLAVTLDDRTATHTRHLDATLDKAPASMSLALVTTPGSSAQSWTYNASDRIAAIDVHELETEGAAIRQAATIHFEDFPTSATLTQDSPTHAELQTSSPIGVSQIGFATGTMPQFRAEPAYLARTRTATTDSLSFRLLGLSSPAELDSGDPFVVAATMAPGPFRIAIADGAATANATIADLPASFRFTASAAAGSLTYSGASGIASIAVDAADPAGFGGSRATALHLLLTQVPASVGVTLPSGGGRSFTFDANGGTLGYLQAQLTSGPGDTLAGSSDGVLVEDLPDRLVVFGRVTGLKKASLDAGALPALSLQLASPRTFVLDARVPSQTGTGTATALATITSVPASLDLRFASATSIAYSASSAVSSITVDASDPGGLAGRATAAHVTLQGLPAAFDASVDAAGSVAFDAHGGTIGLFQAQLTSGPDEQIDAAEDGILLHDLPDRYVVFARMTGLQKATASAGALPSLSLRTSSGRPFLADIQIPSASGTGTSSTLAQINNVPSSLDLTFPTPTQVSYAASAPVSSITLDAVDPAGLLSSRATTAHIAISGLPSAFDATLDTAGTLSLDAHGASLGLFQAQLTSGPDVQIPAGSDGLLLHDLPSEFEVFARLTGLKSASISQGSLPSLSLSTAGGRPFVADLQVPSSLAGSTATTLASINNLPASLSLAFGGAGDVAYSASSAVASITLDATDPAGLSGRATAAHVLIQSLPAAFDAALGADGSVTLNAHGGTVGMFQAQFTSGPNDTIAASKDGLLLEDTPDRYVLFARLSGLQAATVSQGALPSISMSTTGGRELVLSIAQPTASGSGTATINADIANLPATLSISLANVTSFTYSASAPVGLVTIDASNPDGLSGRATIAHVLLQNLPTAVDTSFASDGTITLDAHGGTVGLVQLLLTSGPDDSGIIGAANDGMLLEDLADRYVTFARMTALRTASAKQPNFSIDSTGGKVFKIDIEQNDATQGKVVYLRATLDHLVPGISIAESDTGGTNLTFNASQSTNSLTLDSNSGDRWNLNTTISNPLPKHFEICSASDGSCTGATNRPYSVSSSERIVASEQMTLNVFDCQAPKDATCPGSPAKYTQVQNLVTKLFEFDTGGGQSAGYLYENTTDHSSPGCATQPQQSDTGACHNRASGTIKNFTDSGQGLQETMGSGFWGDARLGKWKAGCGICFPSSDGKTGFVNCSTGTTLTAYFLGLGIDVKSFLC